MRHQVIGILRDQITTRVRALWRTVYKLGTPFLDQRLELEHPSRLFHKSRRLDTILRRGSIIGSSQGEEWSGETSLSARVKVEIISAEELRKRAKGQS